MKSLNKAVHWQKMTEWDTQGSLTIKMNRMKVQEFEYFISLTLSFYGCFIAGNNLLGGYLPNHFTTELLPIGPRYTRLLYMTENSTRLCQVPEELTTKFMSRILLNFILIYSQQFLHQNTGKRFLTECITSTC